MNQPVLGVKGTAEYVKATGEGTAESPYIPVVQVEGSGGSGGSGGTASTEIYDASFTTIRTFSNTAPDLNNSVPADNEFVSVNLANGIDLLEIYPKDLVVTNAPSSVVIGVWVKIGANTPYSLGTFGAIPGENRATVLSDQAFKSLNPIFQELKAKNTTDIKIACKVIVNGSRSTFVVDNTLSASSTSNVLGNNAGFNNTLCLTNSNNVGLNPGLAGIINFFNPITDAVTLENVSFVTGESLRLPLGSLPTNYIPPLGISGKVVCANIDRATNTFAIIGSAIDFRLLKNRLIRVRISSISSAISVLPNCDGAALAATTTYYLTNVSGSIGNQTAQISANGILPLTFTSQGTGWFYIFPYKDIEGLTINSSNQLLIDGNIINFANDWDAQPVIVSTAGTAAVVTHTGHGFSANDALILGGTTAPGGGILGDILYVIPIDVNTYKLSAVPGGLPVSFTNSGTGLTVQRVGSTTISAITLTPGTPSVISFGSSATITTNHWMGANQRFTLSGTSRPGAAYNYTDLWISATSLAANSFQSVQRMGSPSVAFETAGTAVTLTALIGFGRIPIERTTVIVDGVDNNTLTLKNSAGNTLSVTGLSTGILSLIPVSQGIITSGSILVRPIKEG